MDREELLSWCLENPKLSGWLDGMNLSGPLHLPEAPRSAQALLLALALKKSAPTGPLVVVADSIRSAEQLSWDLEIFEDDYLLFSEIPESSGEVEATWKQRQWFECEQLLLKPPRVILTTEAATRQPLPAPDSLARARKKLEPGQVIDPIELSAALQEAGYEAEGIVVERGQFCRRGGILDVFPMNAQWPVRLEWFGDEIESIREFDPAQQTSRSQLDAILIPMQQEGEDAGDASLADYLRGESRQVILGQGDAPEIAAHDFLREADYDQILLENKRKLVLGELESWVRTGYRIVLTTRNDGEEKRLREWLNLGEAAASIPENKLSWLRTPWPKGFLWEEAGLAVLSDAEIFGRYQTLRRTRGRDRLAGWRNASRKGEFADFREGDHVVHLEYGVGLYLGIRDVEDGEGVKRSSMEIEFSSSARLFVPLEQAYLVSRYVGVGKKAPELDTLGKQRWEKKKKQAGQAVLDYAARLLEVQAERSLERGYAFPADTPWQQEFEESFPYEETVDQLKAIRETKADMEAPRPMDRLICGDVGFGKTEVAIRAAFKAVMAGKQVAFLVPTTVLAQQHLETFTSRMADYPVEIAMVSRFVPPSQQRKILDRVAAGAVDILIGTHRLLSPDISFKDPGLVIVDEEQRFGVEHKDALKDKYRHIDLLTLSATPIPRTLYMALMGTRDMSTIETPPQNRIPVETSITAYDERLIRMAIQRELARGGQVFFLHNRVKTIQRMVKQIRFLVPEAKVEFGHGQMEEHQLEDVMHRFVGGETDVLVSTTIIESGIDIPNANTIIIDRADRFGLADLYQLRGRVGRSDTRAYALLLLPRDLVKGDAGKRVQTIRRYTQLGAGFKVAMRDLEIRGAGNLLGTAQSGHIAAVGFELYCRLLKQSIAQLKGEKVERVKDVKLRLDFLTLGREPDADGVCGYLPADYINEDMLRIQAYRDLAELQEVEDWRRLRDSWKDRFGRWPEPVEYLLRYNRLRIAALAGHITQIDVKGDKLNMIRHGGSVMVDGKYPRLLKQKPKGKLDEIEKWIRFFNESRSSRS